MDGCFSKVEILRRRRRGRGERAMLRKDLVFYGVIGKFSQLTI